MRFNIVILFIALSGIARAQYDLGDIQKDSTKKDRDIPWYEIRQRTYVGGDFSLRFGTQTYIYLAPMIGYDFIPTLSGGFTTMYQLYRIKYPNNTIVSDHTYGGGIFVRYRPFHFFLAQLEFDLFNTTDYTVLFGDRVNVPALQLGAGYAGEMGDRAYYNLMLMYDFIHDPNMPLPQILPGIPFYLRYGFVFYLG